MRAFAADEPFSRAAAVLAGSTDSALRHAVDRRALDRVRRGVYASTALAANDLRRDVLAAAVAYPGLPLSHLSSLLVRGIPIVGVRATPPEMTVAPRGAGNVRGVHAYRARVRDHDMSLVDERWLCLSPARTAIDVARHYPLRTSVPAIDYVLHEKLATADDIRDVLDFCARWPGAPRARQAARLSDSRSESPLESISRLVLPQLGFPAAEPQVQIFDQYDRFVGRGDFYWDESGVVGEADGRSKYIDRDVLTNEKDREMGLEDTGLEVARWYWPDAWSRHAMLRVRLQRAFERGVALSAGHLPRRWTAVRTPRITVL